MLIAVAKESAPGERRVALLPDAVRELRGKEIEVAVEAGAGLESGFEDADYEAAGASIESDGAALLERADVVLKVQPPRERSDGRHEADLLREGAALIGFLRPLDEPELAQRLARRRVTAFALELMPRITRAQAMDALSSQATVGGYRAVIRAAYTMPRLFPMLVTAAGTIQPARVFVIGAGVAGLQAIATARRLGGVVSAYDTRPAVREQVESLGARFVELDLEVEEAETAGGYAREQSEAFYQKQREELARHVARADVVITTALVPGAGAPLLIDEKAVAGMKRGSVIVDLAAANGGNCALTKADEEVEVNGVHILGPTNLASEAPVHASQMYTRNLMSFLGHLVPEKTLQLDLEDELTRGPLLAHEGEVKNDAVRKRLASESSEG